jgi:hypothetical protein
MGAIPMKLFFLLGMFFTVYGGSETRYESLELQADLSHIKHAVVTWSQSMFLLSPSLRPYVEAKAAVVHNSILISYRDRIVDTAPHDGLDPP